MSKGLFFWRILSNATINKNLAVLPNSIISSITMKILLILLYSLFYSINLHLLILLSVAHYFNHGHLINV